MQYSISNIENDEINTKMLKMYERMRFNTNILIL